MKAGDLLNTLLKSANFDTTDKAFIDVLSKADFANTDIPESVASALTNNLLTLESAKNNPLLKKHYYGNALQPINDGVEKFLTEFGVDSATIQEIVADQNTYSKYEKAVKKIAEIKEKANNSTNKGHQVELEKQLNELNQKLSLAATESQLKVDSLRNEYEGKMLNREVDFTLSNKNLPGIHDREIETTIARQLVEKALNNKGAIIKNVDGKIAIRQKENPEMDIFIDGKALTFDALTDMALAENKFIKVSDTNGNGSNGFNPTPNRGSQAPAQSPTAQSAISNLDIALEGLK